VNRDNRPLVNGVNSSLMGTIDPRITCQTCRHGLTGNCPGHLGHIELPVPLYHVQFIESVFRLLKVTCFWNSCLLFDPADAKVQRIIDQCRDNLSQRFLELTPPSKAYATCRCCGKPQPRYEQPHTNTIVAHWSTAMREKLIESVGGRALTPLEEEVFLRPLVPADAASILRNMKDEDLVTLGQDPVNSHPSWAIITKLVVPPPVLRPGMVHFEGSRSGGQDESTQKLRDILRKREELNNTLQSRKDNGEVIPLYLFLPEQEARWASVPLPDEMTGIQVTDVLDHTAITSLLDPNAEFDEDPLPPPLTDDAPPTPSAPTLIRSAMTAGLAGQKPPARKRRRVVTKDIQNHYGLATEIAELQEEVGSYFRTDTKAPKAGTTGGSAASTNNPSKEKIEEAARAERGNGSASSRRGARGGRGGRGGSNSRDRPGRSLTTKFKGKRGIFRSNLLGKRVEFCARTVISPDPFLDMDEVGVPLPVALTLTYQERVTRWNIEHLQQAVLTGPKKLGGASNVFLQQGGQMQMISLEHFKGENRLIVLKPGDVVERYMKDGDLLLFNRHPSLHKLSMMGHRAKIWGGKTFRFNPLVCKPYNADFDGDEMNIHFLQNEAARAEAQELCSVSKNLLAAKNNAGTCGMIQDGTSGVFMLTRRDSFLTRAQVMQCMMQARHLLEPHQQVYELPPPAVMKPQKLWTGKQILSWFLPRSLSYDRFQKGAEEDEVVKNFEDMQERHVHIVGGEVLTGCLTSECTGAGSGSLMHQIANDLDQTRAMHFLSDVNRLAIFYLYTKGHTIGIADCLPPPDLKARSQEKMEKCMELIRVFREQPNLDLALTAHEQELHEIRLQNSLLDSVTKDLSRSINPRTNNMARLVDSGAKGTKMSEAMIMLSVGAQTLNGKQLRPENGKRVLPSMPIEGDPTPRGKGYIDRSYIQGLTAVQLYLSFITGRDALIAVAVKVSTFLSPLLPRADFFSPCRPPLSVICPGPCSEMWSRRSRRRMDRCAILVDESFRGLMEVMAWTASSWSV